MFEPINPEDVPDIPLPSKRLVTSTNKNTIDSLIGGCDSSITRWQTTTQSANEGVSYNANGGVSNSNNKSKKKIFKEVEPNHMISPITGEKIADYGTWAEDLRLKREGLLTNNNDIDDQVIDDPVIMKLKQQFAKRGAKGISILLYFYICIQYFYPINMKLLIRYCDIWILF